MTYTPPTEAIEAALIAWPGYVMEEQENLFREFMTAALSAAAPFIRAAALRDAAEEMNAKYEAVEYGHWRGRDYAEGKEMAYEDACDWLRARAASFKEGAGE